MVDQLLSLGADPAIRDAKVNATPADWAAHDGHAELAEFLRSRETASDRT
jgi:ankyrin repeat protein